MSGTPLPSLVCLPFAGAAASFYRPWAALSGGRLDIVPVQLPGRERRIAEEPHRTIGPAVQDLLGQVPRDRAVALFGHSVGAILAYELAQRMPTVPVRVFVSGSPPPDEPRADRATGLPDDEFLARVGRFADLHHEAMDDPEMRELLLPTLRADVALHEDYVPSTTRPLPVPVTALRGSDDALVGADEAARWAKFTSRDFSYVEVPGRHMYLTESAGVLLETIVGELADQCTARRP